MHELNQAYWDERHRDGDTPWNLKMASPAITKYIDQIENKSLRILIPGAGHAHEVQYLIDHQFTDITVCDISTVAMDKIKRDLAFTNGVKYITGDFFELVGTYDLILEQTFFCALDPQFRIQYVDKMYDLLAEGGTLAGILFASLFSFPGPPFGGTKDEYKSLFGKKLYIRSIEMCYNSVLPRQGNELFIICKKSKV